MVTRFYLTSNTATPPNAPGFAGWTRTSEGLRRNMSPVKDGTAMVNKNFGGNAAVAADGTVLAVQFHSQELATGTAFVTTDTIKCQIRCQESGTNDNLNRSPIAVFVYNGTTLQATLKALGHIGPNTTEWVQTGLSNKTFADGDTLDANYTTVAGDYLVVEVGGQVSTLGGTSVTGTMSFGSNSGTDLGENETDTDVFNPWFEISRTLTFVGITTSVLDSFTRADENPLANGNWSGPIWTGDGQMKLTSNFAVGQGSGFSNSYWSASTFGADCEVFATLSAMSGAANDVILLYARLADVGTASPDGYAARYEDNTSLARIRRIDNGVLTTLGADIPLNLAAGDKLGMRIVGSLISLYAFQSGFWNFVASRTDATYTAAGYIGLEADGNTSGDYHFDDFGGGTLGGTTFNQSVSVTATATPALAKTKQAVKTLSVTATTSRSMVRSVGKHVSDTMSTTATITKSVAHALAITSILAAVMVRISGKAVSVTTTTTATIVTALIRALTIAVTVTGTATMVRSVGKSIAVTATVTAPLVRNVSKAIVVTSSATATMIRRVNKTLTVTSTLTAALTAIRVFLRSLDVTAVATSALTRVVSKPVSVTSTVTVSMVRSVNKVVSVTASLTETQTAIKVILKAVSVTATTTATIARSVGKPVAVTITTASTMRRTAGKTVSVIVASAAMIVKQVNKSVGATVTATASLTAVRAFLRALSATAAMTATLTRAVGKPLAVGLAATVGLRKNIAKLVATVTTASASMVRGVAHPRTLAVTATGTATMRRSVGKTQSVTVAATATIVRSVTHAMGATITTVPTMVRSVGKMVARTVVATATMSRVFIPAGGGTTFNQALSVTVTATATMTRTIGKTLASTVSLTAISLANLLLGPVVPVFNPSGIWLPLGYSPDSNRKYLHQIQRETEAERHD